MLFTVLLLIIGLVILILGAESLVRGASSVSAKFGVPPIVIGLTIVAFGTSMPELIVGAFSALQGTTDIAIGNVVGSNIANILLILGISAMVMTLKVKRATTWKEIPFSALAMLMAFIMANDVLFDGSSENILTRTDGLVLIGFFVIFLYYTFSLVSSNKKKDNAEEEKVTLYSTSRSVIYIIAGLVGLFFGGQLLVQNASEIARLMGMSELLIGLTIVAIGTSLPELATSILAAKRGQTDIAIGNVVGSNIFNVFWILGMSSIIAPLPVSAHANIDFMVALAATLALFIALFIGKNNQINRAQGAALVLLYVVYTVYLVIRG